MAEWFKALLVSQSTLVGVGSNPTPDILLLSFFKKVLKYIFQVSVKSNSFYKIQIILSQKLSTQINFGLTIIYQKFECFEPKKLLARKKIRARNS